MPKYKTIREAVGQAILTGQQWSKLVYIVDEEPSKAGLKKKARFEMYVLAELPAGAKIAKHGKLDFSESPGRLVYSILKCLEANGGLL